MLNHDFSFLYEPKPKKDDGLIPLYEEVSVYQPMPTKEQEREKEESNIIVIQL